MPLVVRALAPAILAICPALAAQMPVAKLDTVTVPSGALQLRALLWTPPGPGPFPGILFNRGASCAVFAASEQAVGALFAGHGYAVLYLHRRGDGLSANQSRCMGALLQEAAQAQGPEARNQLQVRLLLTEQLDDALAGLAYLRAVPAVDPRRIAAVGHSFGGQLTLLLAARDSSLRAAVTFAAAALSWERSAALREQLLATVRTLAVPLMIVHASNDSSTAPAYAFADELRRQSKPHELLILGPYGHAALYTAVAQWEAAVFRFLDARLKR